MRVLVVTPAPRGSRRGNRVTALRWAGLLRRLAHRVAVAQEYRGQECHLLIALHARHSAPSVERFRRERPAAALVVALTGTDVYGDIGNSAEAQRSIELADRLIALQPLAAEALPERLRSKVRVIRQSATRPTRIGAPDPDAFDVCVVGHLRSVKDPLRAAKAARRLPPSSRVRVLHFGGALSAEMEAEARAEAASNPRYRWRGARPRLETLRTLASCRLLVLSSVMEGGANVVSEAIVCGVPVLSSRIPGSIGLLGVDYPGYFPVGDTDALAALIQRAETDGDFYADLCARCEALRPLFDPARECESWRELVAELGRA